MRVLKEITPREATAFRYVANSDAHSLYQSRNYLPEVEGEWEDSAVFITLRDIVKHYSRPIDRDYRSIERDFTLARQGPGAVVSFFSVASGKKLQYPYNSIYDSERRHIDDLDPMCFAMLKSLGLITEYRSSELWFGSHVISVHAYHLTHLGGRFYMACEHSNGWIDGGKYDRNA